MDYGKTRQEAFDIELRAEGPLVRPGGSRQEGRTMGKWVVERMIMTCKSKMHGNVVFFPFKTQHSANPTFHYSMCET